MLHVVHQGVAQHMIASMLSHHYEDLAARHLTLKQLEGQLQRDAWKHYKRWARRKGLGSCSMQFNLARFNRESWQSYPELASCYKGAVVKTMVYWVADFLREHQDSEKPDTALRADASYMLAKFHHLQDTHGAWFDSATAQEASNSVRTFLILYQKLAGDAMRAGRRLYRLVPKFHVLLHMALRLPEELRNPRWDHLYQEEDFMRVVGKVASRTHATTMSSVTLLRYRAMLEFGAIGHHKEAKAPHSFLKLRR